MRPPSPKEKKKEERIFLKSKTCNSALGVQETGGREDSSKRVEGEY
jgi:hypothetical protein